MKLGISTASFFSRISLESVFDVIKQMRIDTIEVFLNTFSEYEKEFVDEIITRKTNLSVYSIHALGSQFEPELFSLNPRARADAELIFKKVCYAGYLLGAKFYTFHGPLKLKNTNYNFDYIRLGERMNQLIEIAQSYGIRISYENVHWTFGSNPEFFTNMLKHCPGLYCTLDVKQALQGGCDPLKFLDAMDGRISTVHLCDILKDGITTTLPGKGKINFERLFTEIQKRNQNPVLMLEAYSRDYKDINELKASYDYLFATLIKIENK